MRIRACVIAALSATALLSAVGCRSVYYDLNEGILGRHKRDILSSRVEAAREDQQEAQEQFLTTFELFQQATGFQGGDLEDFYEQLKSDYDASVAKATAVRERIDSIEQVAGDLFAEWESEIAMISNPELRRRSTTNLRDTRARYGQLITAMQRAESKMDPVLVAFTDQVLYLKHNLNARAIASLEQNVVAIQDDVTALVRDMQAAIQEAERFVASMEG
jgi:hypothetical protein